MVAPSPTVLSTHDARWLQTALKSTNWERMIQGITGAMLPTVSVMSTRMSMLMFWVSTCGIQEKEVSNDVVFHVLRSVIWQLKGVKSRGAQLFKTSRNQLKIIGARRVTWSKFHTEDPISFGHYRTKFSHHGDLVVRICAFLVKSIIKCNCPWVQLAGNGSLWGLG